MGFFPREQLGFAFLTNLEPARSNLFNFSIQSSLLSRLFGLNEYMIALLESYVPILAKASAELAARTNPVDPSAVAPYLGLYSQGFRLERLTCHTTTRVMEARGIEPLSRPCKGRVFPLSPRPRTDGGSTA